MVKGYIYRITILNSDSNLYKSTYVGKHCPSDFKKSNALFDGYWGSGRILKDYYAKWGLGYKVKKEILDWIYLWNDVSSKEQKFIEKDQKPKTKFLFFKQKSKNINLVSAKKKP